MRIPFDFNLALRILLLYLIVNLAVLPPLVLLSADLHQSYLLLTLLEGLISFGLGCLQVFNSLFSTMEVEDHRYVGDGFIRFQLKQVEVTARQRREMRTKGVTIVVMSLMLIFSLTVWDMISNILRGAV